jgi:hypothetical protein
MAAQSQARRFDNGNLVRRHGASPSARRLAGAQVAGPQLAAVDHDRHRAPHLDLVIDEGLPTRATSVS